MEILNTPENKAAFMAQYYGQKVAKYPHLSAIYNLNHTNLKNIVYQTDAFLQLRSLSSITDDEAIEVLNFMGFNSANDGNLARATILALFVISSNDMIKYELIVKQMLFDFGDISSTVEKIRSMGFAYKWRGLSVEQQITYGWISLTKATTP